MKECSVCKKQQTLENYYNYARSKDGKSYRCKLCDDLAREKWRSSNPDRSALSARRRQLRFNYDMSLEDYDCRLKLQNGKCAVCGTTNSRSNHGKNSTSNFSVDHNHSSGIVRGLLCNKCNRALGLLNDDPMILRNGADYLEQTLEN